MGRNSNQAVLSVTKNKFIVVILDILLIVCIYILAPRELSEFIYFQF